MSQQSNFQRSASSTFAPKIVHDAETFVPAAFGPYAIRPYGPSHGKKRATIKAYVRMGVCCNAAR